MPTVGTVLEDTVLALSRRGRVRRRVETSPGSREVLHRFIAGTTAFQALSQARDLQATGRPVSISYLGADADGRRPEPPDAALAELLGLLEVAEVTGRTADGGLDLDVRPAALGDATAEPGSAAFRELLARLTRLARAAANAGATVTLAMEGTEVVATTLALAAELRQDFPDVGVTVQSALARTEEDCRALAAAGARVRLCKGAYPSGDEGVGARHDVDRSFVRCLGVLLQGRGQVLVATHDPRLVAITDAVADAVGCDPARVEFQMSLGIMPLGQIELADRGSRLRVLVPYGPAWYSYLMSRVAQRPATAIGLARSVLRRH